MTSKITLYQDANFKGASRDVTDSISDLKSIGFNDRVSSIKVVGSVWVGYEHTGYNGRQYILEEGDYPIWHDWKGANDELSSLKKLNPDIGDTPQITLYQDANYGGRAMTFTYDIDNLQYYNFNDEASSLKVKSGIWILYQDFDFKGKQYVATEGSYPHWDSWRGANDQISSLRPIKEPFFPTEVSKMTFDIAAGFLNSTPVALVNVTQTNNTSVDQEAKWGTKRTLTTTKTFEWQWENSTAVSVSTTFKTGVPVIAEGEISMGVENTFSIGEKQGKQNAQSDEWSVEFPAKIKAKTRLQVQVNIQQGKIDVPFTAILKKGNKVWKEVGTYRGTQSYNVNVDYNETPL